MDSVSDVTGGFKAIQVAALATIDMDNLNARGYIFEVSLILAFLLQRFKVVEVPITFSDRQYGASKLKLRDIIEFL